jgi:F0F1-type ATP synthase alpha subunit
MIPIGRGQRELIIGDRQTGKTTIASTPSINQARINKARRTRSKEEFPQALLHLRRRSARSAPPSRAFVKVLEEPARWNTRSSSPPPLPIPPPNQYLAPFAGCAMGEWFRDNGMHALIIYDDLSKQAVAYRQMSLIAAPRRAAKPIPATCSICTRRLLERAAKLARNTATVR